MRPAIKTPNSLVFTVSMNVRRSLSMPDALLRSSMDASPFTPLVFTTSGGMAPEATTFFRRLAGLVSEKRGSSYSATMNWIRCFACLFLFSDILFFAFEAAGPLRVLSATQLAMLRSTLLSKDCNSIFLLRYSHENLPNLSFPNCFPSMCYSHCPLSACTHFFTDTRNLFTYFWQIHTLTMALYVETS